MASHSPFCIFDIITPRAHLLVFAGPPRVMQNVWSRAGCLKTVTLGVVLTISRSGAARSAQARYVTLPGVFFPILAEPAMRRLLVRVCPQPFDVDVDAQARACRQ